jgi:uncharacterized protein YcfJ
MSGETKTYQEVYMQKFPSPYSQATAVFIGAVFLTLVGCSEPLTTREKGALVGGAAGAGTGAIVGGGTGAAVGGAVGAAGGGLVGDQLQARDEQIEEQQQEIHAQQRQLDRQQEELNSVE